MKKYEQRSIYTASIFATLSLLYTGSLLNPLSVLLVMSPAATSLAFHSGLTTYINTLYKRNIYIKNVEAIEKIIDTENIIFDKTGTLSSDKLKVSNFEIYDEKYKKKELMKICSNMEADIMHPVAHTLDFNNNFEDNSRKVIYIPSRGVKGIYKNKKLLIGNEKFMRDNEVNLQKYKSKEDNYSIMVYIAIEEKITAAITLKEKLKDNVYDLTKLKNDKKIAIISGDKGENVKNIAEVIGIDYFQGDMSYREKESYIKNIDGSTMMVGDGINDLAAMNVADFSIAINKDSYNKTIVQSDCIILNDDISSINSLIEISEKSYNQIERVMNFNKNYNIIFSIFALTDSLTPFQAKAVNTLNSVLTMFYLYLINKIMNDRY